METTNTATPKKVWVLIRNYTYGTEPRKEVKVFDSRESLKLYEDAVRNEYRSSVATAIYEGKWETYELPIEHMTDDYRKDPSWWGPLD